ncbi:DUF5684 domain-containing protein [Cellulomonas soli]
MTTLPTLLLTSVTTTTTTDTGLSGGAVVGMVLLVIVAWLIAGLPVAGVFEKAGEPGWQGFVPFWNTIVLLRIAGKPWWWFLLMVVPVVGIVLQILLYHQVSLSFGHGAGFTVGLVLVPLIFLYALWLDSSTYRGPDAGRPVAPAV